MKYAIYSPGFGAFSDPHILAGLAHDAEDSGWDGFFLWDHVLFTMFGNAPIGDPWITLAAMAMSTTRIRLGTLVTPVPRRRPWLLARELTTLDHLSHGRMVLGVGIGDDRFGCEYSAFGEPPDARTHAAMLDEGLEVLTGLWRGEPFSYSGQHYHVEEVTFLPTPIQHPRIPIWVAGNWPHKKPFRRAARWDGVAPGSVQGPLTPADYRAITAHIRQFRAPNTPLDVVRPAPLPAGSARQVAAAIAEYEAAGVTWWLVPLEDDMGPPDEWRDRVRQGPPPA